MNDITARADALGNPASTPSDALEAARRILKQPAHYDDDELLMDARIVAEVFLAASPSPWRSMESAPKDGTRFLAAAPYIYREGGVGLPEDRCDIHIIAADPDFDPPQLDSDLDLGWSWDAYTYWQPLPSPPSEGEK